MSGVLKSLLMLLENLINDWSVDCPAIDRQRDMEYIRRRVEHEGLSFLTITLPSFGAQFTRALADGFLDTTLLTGFKRSKSGLPRFLGGFLIHVFNKDGTLANSPNALAIALIRQITYTFKKVEVDCTETRKAEAIRRYCEVDLDNWSRDDATASDQARIRCVSDASRILSTSIAAVEASVFAMELIPKHGPGATATPSSPNSKWVFQEWNEKMESLFPFTHYAMASVSAIETLVPVKYYALGQEPAAKLALVPKTLETPRVICIEPAHVQFMQQGVRSVLYDAIERDRTLGGQINFLDQTINKDLAKTCSISGDLATIDMKDASDRVSQDLVRLVFSRHSIFLDALEATRSSKVKLPNGQEIVLRKFASMGSALCFPVEAMCFYVLAIAAIVDVRGLPSTMTSYRRIGKEVFVYGDDIIVPVGEAGAVIDYYETFGLKVNRRKTFLSGKFRESCGGDYYDGADTTPIYCRSLPPDRRTSPAIANWVAMSNQFLLKGYWKAANYCRHYVDKIVGYNIPYAQDETAGCTYTTFLDSNIEKSIQGFCKRLHKPTAKAPVVEIKRYTDPLDSWYALHKSFSLALEARLDDHLQRSVRRGVSTVKHRMVALVP